MGSLLTVRSRGTLADKPPVAPVFNHVLFSQVESSTSVNRSDQKTPMVWMPPHLWHRGFAQALQSAPILLISIGMLIPGCRKSNEAAVADLEKAIRRGDAAQVERSLDAAPSLVGVELASGKRPLHVAAATGHVPVIELLIARGADIEAPDARQRTPLLHAATHRRSSAAKCLLDHGAELTSRDVDGHTALHIAVQDDHASTVALLIQHGADVNTTLKQGTTPLHSALLLGFEDIAALLLEAGADTGKKTIDGHTPLSIARSEARQDLVDLLLKHGAK